jgi:hypothetical protein
MGSAYSPGESPAGASRKVRNRDGVAAADAASARSFDGLVTRLNGGPRFAWRPLFRPADLHR